MTFKKSLKLTALGLGVVTIALTGCKNKSNDGVAGKDGKDGIVGKDGKQVTDTNGIPIILSKLGEPGTIGEIITRTKDEHGNEVIIRKPIDATKGSFQINVGKVIPSNSCIPFKVTYKDHSGVIEVNDTTAFYDENNQHNGNIQVVLSSESQSKFKIKDGHICVLKQDELNKRNRLDKHVAGAQTSIANIDLFKAAIVGDKAVLQVKHLDLKLGEAVVEVGDSNIDMLRVVNNKHIIPAGASSISIFNLYGTISERDSSLGDKRANKNVIEVKNEDREVELTNLNSKVNLIKNGKVLDVLYYDKDQKGWKISSKNLPVTSHYDAYRLEVLPNEGSITLTKEIEIKVIPAIVTGFEFKGIHTNIHGISSFDIIAKYSDETIKPKSIFDLKDGEASPFTLDFKIRNKAQPNNVVNNILIYRSLNTRTNLVNTNNYIPSFGDKLHIDASTAPHFGSSNNDFYELEVGINYASNYNGLTAEEIAVLAPHKAVKLKTDEDSLISSRTLRNDKFIRQFIVSDKSPVLKLSYKYFNNTTGDYSVAGTNVTGEVNTVDKAVLPQGGIEYDNAFKKGQLCVKAFSNLVFEVDDNRSNDIVISSYANIADIVVGSGHSAKKLASNNKNYSVNFDKKANENLNIICAAKNGDENGDVTIRSQFQNLESNPLDIDLVKAVELPVITFAYENRTKHFELPNTFNSQVKIVPYVLMSDDTLGRALAKDDSRVASINYNLLTSTKTPFSIIKPSADNKLEYPVLNLDSRIENSATNQQQKVMFSDKALTLAVNENELEFSRFKGITHYTLDQARELTAIVDNLGYTSLYHYEEDQFMVNRAKPETAQELTVMLTNLNQKITAETAKVTAAAPEKIQVVDAKISAASNEVIKLEADFNSAKKDYDKAVEAERLAKEGSDENAKTTAAEALTKATSSKKAAEDKLQTANKAKSNAEAEKAKLLADRTLADAQLIKLNTDKKVMESKLLKINNENKKV